MPNRSSLSDQERDLRSRLHLLLNNAESFLHGSPIEMARRCGNPNCRCASNDQYKHRCLMLGQTRKGKTSMVYIPRHLEARVRQGIGSFQQALALLEELNLEARKRLDQAKAKKSETRSTRSKAATPSTKKKKKKSSSRKPRKPS
jgi:hypothetical protein